MSQGHEKSQAQKVIHKKEGTYVRRRLVHVDVQQKPAQHWKAITLQLKINIFYKGHSVEFIYITFSKYSLNDKMTEMGDKLVVARDERRWEGNWRGLYVTIKMQHERDPCGDWIALYSDSGGYTYVHMW